MNSKMRITVLDGFTLNPGDLSWREINTVGDLVVYDRTEPNLVVNRIATAGVVLTNKTPITRETIDACPSIKMIGVMATGYDVVDIAYAREKGIVVCNVPAYSTPSVTQHVFAMLFAITNHVSEHSQSVRLGEWQHNADFAYWKYPIFEISGKTMGIIGMGATGKRVAAAARAFGMKVLAYNGKRSGADEEDLRYVPLEELISSSDIISLHCPLTPETNSLIRRETIQKMKRGVIVINTARGQVIDEQDLADALSSGQVGFAAVDVLREEPPRSGSPLIDNPKCLVTPHIAWAPREARERCITTTLHNIEAFLSGSPQNIVNP